MKFGIVDTDTIGRFLADWSFPPVEAIPAAVCFVRSGIHPHEDLVAWGAAEGIEAIKVRPPSPWRARRTKRLFGANWMSLAVRQAQVWVVIDPNAPNPRKFTTYYSTISVSSCRDPRARNPPLQACGGDLLMK